MRSKRRFAGAGAADDPQHLAARHLERNVVDGGQRTESLCQTFNFQHCLPLDRSLGQAKCAGRVTKGVAMLCEPPIPVKWAH